MKKLISGAFATALMATGLLAAPAVAAEERELVEVEAPEYPRAAERRELEGHVVVRYTVAPGGEVTDVEVVESIPSGVFDRAVMRALESWRYVAADAPTEGIERQFDFKLGS